MRYSHILVLTLLLAWYSAVAPLLIPGIPAVAADNASPSGAAAASVLSQDLQQRLGLECDRMDFGKLHVNQVQSNSTAAEANIGPGDFILEASLQSNMVDLIVDRGGQRFLARLPVPGLGGRQPSLAKPTNRPQTADRPLSAAAQNGRFKAVWYIKTAPIEQSQRGWRTVFLAPPYVERMLQVMANYQIEYILDHDNSVDRPDAPEGLTRWQWCGKQLETMTDALSLYSREGLTLTVCDGSFSAPVRVQRNDIYPLMSRKWSLGNADIKTVLNARINDYLSLRTKNPAAKPLLITVISDKQPSALYDLSSMVKLSQKLADSREVIVCLANLADDWSAVGSVSADTNYKTTWPEGERVTHLCADDGAKFNILSAVPPTGLRMHGLLRCAWNTIESNLLTADANGWSEPQPNSLILSKLTTINGQWLTLQKDCCLSSLMPLPGNKIGSNGIGEPEYKRRANELNALQADWYRQWCAQPLCGEPWQADPPDQGFGLGPFPYTAAQPHPSARANRALSR